MVFKRFLKSLTALIWDTFTCSQFTFVRTQKAKILDWVNFRLEEYIDWFSIFSLNVSNFSSKARNEFRVKMRCKVKYPHYHYCSWANWLRWFWICCWVMAETGWIGTKLLQPPQSFAFLEYKLCMKNGKYGKVDLGKVNSKTENAKIYSKRIWVSWGQRLKHGDSFDM